MMGILTVVSTSPSRLVITNRDFVELDAAIPGVNHFHLCLVLIAYVLSGALQPKAFSGPVIAKDFATNSQWEPGMIRF